MFRGSYKIATVMGIPIRIHISLIIILVYLVAKFGFRDGLLLELGLATSIILHELGHSAVAMQKGCRVREITLLVVGGAAQMERVPRRPLDEFLMAAAGPAVSVLLGTAFLFAGFNLPLPPVRARGFYPFNILQILGVVNLGLVVFNLLPAFPMDGGRILRAMLVPRLGRLRATRLAARLGQILAILFAVYAITNLSERWVLLLIAPLVYIAAGHEARMVAMEEARKRRGAAWQRSGNLWSEPPEGNDVIISPPPYRREPDTHTDILEDREDPLRPFHR